MTSSVASPLHELARQSTPKVQDRFRRTAQRSQTRNGMAAQRGATGRAGGGAENNGAEGLRTGGNRLGGKRARGMDGKHARGVRVGSARIFEAVDNFAKCWWAP